MEKEEFQMEPEVTAALTNLTALLTENSVIKDYQAIEAKVENHPTLLALTEEIRQHQQDAVKFNHYGKPAAEQEALRLAEEKTKEFDTHPLVIRYREKLTDANDLIQYLTQKIERQLNSEWQSEQ